MVNTRVRTAAILLGIGLGGFFDGIVLHQILQWHNMLSGVLPPESMEAMRRNMAADGMFHAMTWLATLAGVFALWSAFTHGGVLPRTSGFVGYLLLGWGWFNLIEGLVNHHVLGLHHVRDLPEHVPAYDWAFLLVGGIGFIALGMVLRKSKPRAIPERRAGYERRGTLPTP
jgi:uncharacterized membrane protein